MRRAGVCALLALALTSAPALGQSTTNIAPPPERFAIAPGGVDMRSGRYVYSQTDLSMMMMIHIREGSDDTAVGKAS